MFTKVVFQEQETRAVGLEPATLRDLKPVVILVGPNGGGKSRYLGLLKDALADGQKTPRQERVIEQIGKQAAHSSLASRSLERAHEALQNLNSLARSALEPTPLETRLFLAEPPEWPARKLDPLDLPRRALSAIDKQGVSLQSFETVMARVPTYLDAVARASCDSRNREMEQDQEVVRLAAFADRFNEVLQALLQTECTWKNTPHGAQAELFARPASTLDELSAGQRYLLTWTVALFADGQQNTFGTPTILAVDEPECRLHPSIAIDILTLLRDLIFPAGGQLWIATHSPIVLAHFAPEASVYDVRNNKIDFAGSNLEDVVNGLLGGADSRQRLRDFMADADEYAFHKFAAESLLAPGVANKVDDDQSQQLFHVCREKLSGGGMLRLLDYGSGAGRFARALSEMLSAEERAHLDYNTWDHRDFDDSRADRVAALKCLYPDLDDPSCRISNEVSDFFHDDDRRVDAIVMANFHHEVPPAAWCDHLRNVVRALRERGSLVVLEDQQMRVGELPHARGFIVLNLAEWRTLLGNSKAVVHHPKSNAKCSIVVIGREALLACDDETAMKARLDECLNDVKRRLLEELKALRERGERTHVAGRTHARLAMQVANVELSLRAI